MAPQGVEVVGGAKLMNKQLTLQDALEQLNDEGYPLSDDHESTILDLVSEDERSESQWYVRFFIGLSAWIAAILFIAFLFIADILQDEEIGFIVGLVFCAIAVGINRLGPRNPFLGQLGLALSLAGQILFLIGLYSILNYEVVLTALGLIIMELVLVWLYNSGLHRVISTLAILGGVLAIFLDLEILERAIHIFVFVLAAGIVALHYRENHLLIAGLEDLIYPINIGIAVFLLGLLILPLSDAFDIKWWVTAVLLSATLIFLVLQIVKDLGLGLRSGAVPWLLAGCVVLFIPATRMPGILSALIVLLLGFWRNNRLLIGLAAVFFVFYLGAYYYSLEWTLLVKSFALMGTGVIMFLLRYFLLRYARGGTP